MTVEMKNKIITANVVCHFCGRAQPPYETVLRGLSRVCQECLIKHQIDLLIQGTERIDKPMTQD